MQIEYTIVCDCGEKMHTNHGVSINGLEVLAQGYCKKNSPVRYKGANENWRCPRCKREVEVYTGFIKAGE